MSRFDAFDPPLFPLAKGDGLSARCEPRGSGDSGTPHAGAPTKLTLTRVGDSGLICRLDAAFAQRAC